MSGQIAVEFLRIARTISFGIQQLLGGPSHRRNLGFTHIFLERVTIDVDARCRRPDLLVARGHTGFQSREEFFRGAGQSQTLR